MPKPVVQIQVCTNERPNDAVKPSCGAMGADAVYRCFKDVIRARGARAEVMVVKTGCLKHCSRGIVVALMPSNRWYAGVTNDDVEEIVDRSVVGDETIERLVMPDIPWE